MVRSKIIDHDLCNCYENLKTLPIYVNHYSGYASDLACDIATVDSFVAGILSRILEMDNISEQEIMLLRNPVLIGLTWHGHQVKNANLSNYPDLLHSARAIECARVLCLKALGRKRGHP